uniref:Bestrophin homolog n=1 Tax=Eutreptiella gymnastica TaxID=73025 RepID=A0A7S1J0U4_9EUGL
MAKEPKSMVGYQYNPSQPFWKTLSAWAETPVPSMKMLLAWNLLVIACFIVLCEVLPRYYEDAKDAKLHFDSTSKLAFRIYQLWFPFIAFISGFYNQQAYKRWWHMRNSLRVIMGGGIVTAMFLAAEVKSANVRREMCRYIAQAQSIIAWTFRTFHADKDGDGDSDPLDIGLKNPVTGQYCKDWAEYCQCMQDRGIATAEERAILEKAQAPFHLSYEWCLMLLSDAKVRGHVVNPVSACGLIQHQISEQRGHATSVLMHLSTPTPFPYFFLFRFITLTTVLFAPLAIAGISHKGIPTYPMEVIGTMVTTFWAGSMWLLGQDMSDPFGNGVCDFDIVGELQKAEKLMAQQLALWDDHPHIPSLYSPPSCDVVSPQQVAITYGPAVEHWQTVTNPVGFDMFNSYYSSAGGGLAM